jgi:integrase
LEKLARIKTRFTGIYYRVSQTNGKSDKTYYIIYKDTDHKTREIKVGKFSEGVREAYCNQKRNEVISKIRLGEEPPLARKYKKKNKISLEPIAIEYFKTRKDGISKEIDISTFNKHLKNYFDDLEYVTKEDIMKLKTTLKNKTNSRGEFLSEQTVKNIFGILSSIINYGLKENLLKNNIMRFYKRESIDNARERYLSKKEIKKLYQKLDSHEEYLLIFVKISLSTGARAATVSNITKKDINFTQSTITLKDFKNNTTYTGFISQSLNQLLLNFVKDLKANDSLFPVQQDRISKKLSKIFNALFNDGLEKSDRKNRVVVHTLRHTFASHLAINGTPIFTIQKLMNHKDIKMTMRYAKLAPDSGRESVVNLGF